MRPRSRRASPTLLVAALAAMPGAARAQAAAGPVTGALSGYFESRTHAFFGLDPDLAGLDPLLPDGFHPGERLGAIERLRPTLKLHVGETATLVGTVEGHTEHGFFDRRQTSIGDVVGVERLYVTATLDDWDHTAGKQNIAWGSGLLLNPTDLFNDKNPADLQAERPGVWALRSLWAVGDATNLTVAVATPESPCCAPVALARFDTTLDITDLAVLAAWDAAAEAAVVGVDVRSEQIVGLWFEAATTLPAEGDASQRPTTSLETGIDYSFDVLQTLFLSAEYMFQQSGQWRPGDALDADRLRAAVQASGTPAAALRSTFEDRAMFMGRHYGVGLVRLEIASDWRASVLNVTNLVDHTGLVVPQVSFLPADAFTFTLGAQLAYGPSGGEYTLTLPTLSASEAALLRASSPQGAAMADAAGARLSPTASLFLWGRYAY